MLTKVMQTNCGIPLGTYCALFIADILLFCFGRDFMASLSDDKEDEIIEAFNSILRYREDFLYNDNSNFGGMVGRIYPPELQLNKANASDTEAIF